MRLSIKILTCLTLCILSLTVCKAEKPKWVDNTPKELNYTYKFVEVESSGSTLESARADAKSRLQDDTQLQEGIRIYRRTKDNTTIDKSRQNGGKLQESKSQHIEIETVVDGEKFDLQAVKVDEYVEKHNGFINLHTLFMVALCDNPVFDRTYLTTSYGATPVVMSIIPGLGQWYKGSKVKGVCMFGAEAVAVAGIIFTDNQRASYVKKAKEHPKFAVQYGNKADSWETGRNICIGVAAGIWIYNIVDAIVAKGARRVVVNHADGRGLSVAPYLDFDGAAGVSLAYKF